MPALKHPRKYTSYRFRAETQTDVWKFLTALTEECICIRRLNYWIENEGCPCPEVDFETSASLDELRDVCDTVENGHVMLESLNYAAEYDGERYYTPWMNDDSE